MFASLFCLKGKVRAPLLTTCQEVYSSPRERCKWTTQVMMQAHAGTTGCFAEGGFFFFSFDTAFFVEKMSMCAIFISFFFCAFIRMAGIVQWVGRRCLHQPQFLLGKKDNIGFFSIALNLFRGPEPDDMTQNVLCAHQRKVHHALPAPYGQEGFR